MSDDYRTRFRSAAALAADALERIPTDTSPWIAIPILTVYLSASLVLQVTLSFLLTLWNMAISPFRFVRGAIDMTYLTAWMWWKGITKVRKGR